jgi:hypothetical protein
MSVKMLRGILHTKFLNNSWGGTWTMLRKTSPKGKWLNLITSIQPTPNYKYTYLQQKMDYNIRLYKTYIVSNCTIV